MSGSSTNTLGKYQIIREIARSNDIVYEAIDPSLNRRIALKELSIPPNLTGAQKRERIERFLREGRAAGKLAHPNIVTIYEVGKENDRFFIAMEYLEGQTLRDTLQAGGALSIKDVVNYTTQLCSALGYAHQNGIIHRDVKPDNVQILPGGLVKLTDFGIARLMGESSITQDGQVFGTPSYMSPEQVAGKQLDVRSDIFSLGVMLYEMLTGKKPFTGDSVVSITYNIVNTDTPVPPGAPPYLAGIIRKAMAKDPDSRYSSVEEMADDLREERCSGSPFGIGMSQPSVWPGPVNDPFNQQHQQSQPLPPLTPYGTPMPSPGAGASPVSAPNPFGGGHVAPAPAPVYTPPTPSAPLLSAETRNFLGIFMLIIALTGMLIFAGWAVHLAYSSYETAVTKGAAADFFDKGEKAYSSGDITTALLQWTNALHASPRSEVAERARNRIYDVSVQLARQSYDMRNVATLEMHAKRLVEAKPDRPEGYFYLASAQNLTGDYTKAKENYSRAIECGGNDSYAQAARPVLGRLYIEEGDRFAAQGNTAGASNAYNNAMKYGDTQTVEEAQTKASMLQTGR